MTPANVLIAISALWVISEIALARLRRSKAGAPDLDRRSLRVLWITIITCIFTGVFVGGRGVGQIAVYPRTVAWIGLALIAAGLWIRWTAILTLKRYFTVDVSIRADHRIVRRGIYKVLRHPAYTGSLLSFLGLGLSFASWLSTVVIFVPVLVAFLFRIRVEETALLNRFGEEYLEYSKATWRLLPGIY